MIHVIAIGAALAAIPADLPDELHYCTEVGPIHLSFSGEDASGSYQIVLPHKRISGELRLVWSDGHLRGQWVDADGEGPIHIYLHEDSSLTALYTRAQTPFDWSPVWRGQRAESQQPCPR